MAACGNKVQHDQGQQRREKVGGLVEGYSLKWKDTVKNE